MTIPRILAIGGAHMDRRGRMTSPFIPGASIPGTMREDVGGGAFNALRCAIQRGTSGAMLSLRGGDTAGDAVARAIDEAGIEDVSATFLDRGTPSYTALLDGAGDVVAALADMQLYELAFPKQLRRAKVREAIAGADAILCDANIPAAGIERLAALCHDKPLFAIAISPAKAVRLRDALPALSCLYMNMREAKALADAGESDTVATVIGRLRSLGLASGVVTRSNQAVIAFDHENELSIEPPPPPEIVDVTGAGDALAGAMTAALLRGLPLGEALREGMAAASLALASASAVPALARQAFETALAAVPPPIALQKEGTS